MIPKDKIKKILVVTLSNLGDVVLTFPVFEALVQAFPEAEIHAAVGKGGAAALERHPSLARVMVLDKKISFSKKARQILEIRRERYDLIVDLRHSPIGLLGGSRFRNAYFKRRPKIRHQTLKHLQALEGIAPFSPAQSSFLERRSFPENILGGLSGNKKIVVAAVGSKSDIKKWPAESYAALLDRLALNDGFRIVFVGDKTDAQDVARVRSLMRFSGSEDFSGKTDFPALCSILKQSALLVTSDSAPLHIADALKVPVLAFFGPTDPRKYGPRQASSMALKRPLFCSPCEKAQCRFNHECLKELSVDEAYAKARQILGDRQTTRDPKILIIRLDRIGDVVLSLPAVSAIRDRFPNAWISMMVRPATQALVEGHPDIDEVISYDYEKGGRDAFPVGYFRFLKSVISRRFDIAFVLHPSRRSVLVPFLAGIPYRVGLDTGDSFFLTHKAADRRAEGRLHESEYALEVVRAFGIKNLKSDKPRIHVDETLLQKTLEKIERFLGRSLPTRVAAVHAGASCPRSAGRRNVSRFWRRI